MNELGRSRNDPYLSHRGNFCLPEREEKKYLKMSKREGRHVDVNLSKGLHFVKNHNGDRRDLSSKMFFKNKLNYGSPIEGGEILKTKMS